MITKDELLKAGFTPATQSDLFNTDFIFWLDYRIIVVLDKETGIAHIGAKGATASSIDKLLEQCQYFCLEKIKMLSDNLTDVKKDIDFMTNLMFKISDARRSFE